MNIESIADDIIAKRTRNRAHQFPGLASNRAMVRRKYRDHSYVAVGPQMRVRQLSTLEIEQFRAHVDACVTRSAHAHR